ncbi:MAG: hypothetical protein ACE5IR_08725 [bacterium]
MLLRHLNEEIIQEYLENKDASDYHWVPSHLNKCARCRYEVQQYEILFTELQQETGFDLSKNFAESVLGKIQPQTSKAAHWGVLVLISFVAFISALGAALYFIDMTPILSWFGSIQEFLDLEIFAAVNTFLTGLHLDLSLFGFAALVLMIIRAVDHFIMHSKQALLSNSQSL